ENIIHADYIILESTYGNRRHPSMPPDTQLGKIIRETAKRGGSVIIPSFAVGRAQSILLCLYKLKQSGELSSHLPIYLDSPMAISATDLLTQFQDETRLTEKEATQVCNMATYVNTPQESKM